MLREVGLLVLSLAAAISTHSVDVPQGESGMDTTGAGALINKTDPFRNLDAAGVPINDTESLMIFDEDVGFPKRNSIEERKGCSPTISCTRAGGYCIKARADCDGTVDTQGCRGGRKCKCCLPDQTTPAPSTCPTTQPIVTCPTVTPCPTCAIPTTTPAPSTFPTTQPIVTCPIVTPCPTYAIPTTTPAPSTFPTTQPIVTCPTVTPCPTYAIPTTTPAPSTFPTTQTICTCPAVTPCPTSAITTTDIPTTTVVTTEGPTVNPNLSWLTVGSDRFVRFPTDMNWLDARSLCRANGLDLYEPKNVLGVAIYLEDNYSNPRYWVGGKGNGTHQVWFSGKVITRSDPWFGTYYSTVGANHCMAIVTFGDNAKNNGATLFAKRCTEWKINDVLCG